MVVALTVPVGEAKPGETAPRRKASQKAAAAVRPADSKATNIPEYIGECVKRSKNRKAMGWRNLIDTHIVNKQVKKVVNGEETLVDKEWIYYENSEYKYVTYQELLELVQQYSRGLVKLGLEPEKDKLHIFASTSAKWMQSFLAASYQSIPVVTAYDTLGESGLTHSMVQTESNAVFCDNALLGNLLKPLQKATALRYIIHAEPIDPNDKRMQGKFYSEALSAKEKILEARPDVKFVSFDEVIALGKDNPDVELRSPPKEQPACIMYTSGSSGDPKGVVITHENILAAMGGISTNAGRDLVHPGDRVIAFLPLAHIFELAFELVNFWWGGCLGYANVKTLTDASCKNCRSDLVEFKPQIMVGVAAVWESVRKGIMAKVRQKPALVQKLFWASYKAKSTLTNYNIPGASAFDIIFKAVKAATGGELKIVLNGGSPISTDAQTFISTLIAPMLIGYGLTETCANTTIVEHNHIETGVVGTLVGSITAKLVDVPDAGYFAKDNQGEIWVQGKCVVSEYYKNEKETSEAFTDDGWFKTGDIGQWEANGALRIIDRKKNLVKTLNGEYIALEKLESVYRSNPVVLNLCVYADQSKVKPIAMILPNESHLKQYLVDNKTYTKSELETKDLSVLCEDKKVINAVLNSLLTTGKSQGLKGIELLQTVVLIDDEWTPQNGLVTSAQKLQRKKILTKYEDQVKSAYEKS